MKYETSVIHFHREEDIFEHGCQPATGYSTSYGFGIKAETFEEWLKKAGEHCLWRDPTPEDYDLNACEEDGRVDFQVMVDVNNHPATEREIGLWKEGKKRLYHATFTFYIETVTRSTPHLIIA